MMDRRIILSINAGSSSIKTAAYQTSGAGDLEKLASVQIENLGNPSSITVKYDTAHPKNVSAVGEDAGKSSISDFESSTPEDGFRHIVDHLIGDRGPIEIQSKEDINFVTHRIVHGGEAESPKVLDKALFEYLDDLSDLAPLHNATALKLIRAAHHQLPSTNVLCFDTAFHTTLPKQVRSYPIDPKIASHNNLRRYGFHGISYQFIVNAVSKYLEKPLSQLNIIAFHLGSGSSACCIKSGQSIDTSMGLTPLSGLPGATRAGSVDPSLVFHYTHDAGKMSSSSSKELHVTVAEEILNKRCGWKAMSGTIEFGEIAKRAKQAKDYEDGDNGAAKLAFDLFIDRILSYIGSYYLKLEGQVDAVVFAGGVGERSEDLRKEVVYSSKCLGIHIDDTKNAQVEKNDAIVTDISAAESKIRVLVCHTDEQVQMAIAVKELTGYKA